MAQWVPVKSSMIGAVSYDPETRVLQVRFNNGSVYEYDDVLQDDAEGLMSAASAGTYFHTRIKDVYSGSQVS